MTTLRRLAQIPRLLPLTLALALVSTPVSYSGGAQQPHPHAFLQFLLDAHTGDFRHHAGDGETPHGGDHASDHAPGHTSTQEEAPRVGDMGDAPVLSSSLTPEVRRLALALDAAALLPGEPACDCLALESVPPRGLALEPTSPPPRRDTPHLSIS